MKNGAEWADILPAFLVGNLPSLKKWPDDGEVAELGQDEGWQATQEEEGQHGEGDGCPTFPGR